MLRRRRAIRFGSIVGLLLGCLLVMTLPPGHDHVRLRLAHDPRCPRL
jgi:hypothetical protein